MEVVGLAGRVCGEVGQAGGLGLQVVLAQVDLDGVDQPGLGAHQLHGRTGGEGVAVDVGTNTIVIEVGHESVQAVVDLVDGEGGEHLVVDVLVHHGAGHSGGHCQSILR